MIRPGQVRMDILSSFGQHLASLELNQKEIKILNIGEKTMYIAAPNTRMARKWIPIALDVSTLVHLLFDDEVENPNWSCTLDKNNFLKECSLFQGRIIATWPERCGGRKTLVLSDARNELKLELYNFQSKVEGGAESLALERPEGFSLRRL